MFAEASSVLIITRLYQERVSGLKDKANQMIAMMLGPAGHGKSKAIHAITVLLGLAIIRKTTSLPNMTHRLSLMRLIDSFPRRL